MATAGPLAAVPNIVIFFSDDHTQQAISAYQNLPDATPQDLVFKNSALPKTPNIDRIAANGAVFSRSYVSNSICGPSRANLLTGLHSHANGLLNNVSGDFNGAQQTLPKLLQAAGYSTSIVGKWHLGSIPTGFDNYEVLVGQGEYYSPVVITSQPGGGYSNVTYTGQYEADVVTNRAKTWLQNRIDTNQTNPFFLMVNHKGTHRVWQPSPQETDPAVFRHVEWDYTVTPNPDTAPANPASWTPATVPVPANFFDNLNGYPSRAASAAAQQMQIVRDMRLNEDLKLTGSTFGGTAYNEVRTWFAAHTGSLTTAQRAAYYNQRYIKDYFLTAKSVDRSVGDVLDFLETNNLDKNTIIIYASDQGFYLGEHGWFDKRWMYEESMRTPMLMQWKDASGNPLITPGSVNDTKVQVIDYAPTLLQAAGVTGYTAMHGESFLGFATTATGDEPATWRNGLYYHYYEGYNAEHRVGRQYGIRTDRYKLIYQYERANQWELFDLQTDPFEMNNLLYNPSTGIIDDPTNGVDGTPTFQALVNGLLTDLKNLRTQYADTTGPSFTINGVDVPDPNLLINLLPRNATYEGQKNSLTTVVQPSLTNGLSFELSITPLAADLTGTVLLMEIGGNSNGSGIYLINGVPTFIQKIGSNDGATPSSLSDTTLPEVAVQSGIGMLTAGITYRVAAVYTPPAGATTIGKLTLTVQPEGGNLTIDNFSITGASNGGNWAGNKTLSVGTKDPGGAPVGTNAGALSTTAGIYNNGTQKSLSGTVTRALYWNAVGTVPSRMKTSAVNHAGSTFSVSVTELVKGATYRLYRCTNLPFDGSTIEVDSAIVGDSALVLTDGGNPTPLPTDKAFYRVEEIR